jgi:glutamate synthase domain-containing protein 2
LIKSNIFFTINNRKLEIDLFITGGLRVPSGFAKAILMVADVIAIASVALMDVVCQQYSSVIQ